jgi:hypothetical protein
MCVSVIMRATSAGAQALAGLTKQIRSTARDQTKIGQLAYPET